MRGNFDEIEVCLLRQAQCYLNTDDADLLTVGADKSNLWYADTLIRARIADMNSLR